MSDAPFTYKSHRSNVIPFHFFTLPVALLNVIVFAVIAVRQIISGQSPWLSLWLVLVALAFVLNVWYTRAFSARVQDRIIRIEQIARLRELGITEVDIEALRIGHLIALRFADSAEVPALVAVVKARPDTTSEQLKKQIKSWVRDPYRI